MSDTLCLKRQPRPGAAINHQIAHKKNIWRDGQLKHPTQRELIQKFKIMGININARVTGQYLSKMGNEVEFINENYGFVYKNELEKVA